MSGPDARNGFAGRAVGDRAVTGRSVTIAVAIAVVLALLWIATGHAEAKPPRWTERQAETALLSRAHIAYADCVPLNERGRRFLCLIEYTDGGEWYLVLIPGRDGFTVRHYEQA
jgi:hypothetical protein